MTHREAFEKAKAHLLQQNRKAVKPSDNIYKKDECMYRTSDGLKCAVGCLIPDEEYNPEFEGRAASYLVIDLKVPSLQSFEDSFLDALQSVHDSHPVEKWAAYLDAFERNWASTFAREIREV